MASRDVILDDVTIGAWLLDWLGRAATARVRRSFRTPRGASRVDFWAGDGVRLGGWLFENVAPDRSRGTAILAHGYRDDRRQLAHLAPDLCALGMRVLAFDFRAHGESDGSWITIGHDEARDVAAAIDFARSLDRGVGPVAWIGFSMGAASYLQHVACGGDEADLCAVLDSPFDTLREAVGARLDALHLPRSLLARNERLRRDVRFPAIDRVRPMDAAPKLARPTLLLFAPHDPWLPAPTIARFRAAMSASSTLKVLATGRHDDHVQPNHRGARDWRAEVVGFVAAHSPSTLGGRR
jgi:alpha-beta hydrolase superfamily lysophospholipase